MSTRIETRMPELPIGFWLANGAKTGMIAGAIAANLFILLVCFYVSFMSPFSYAPTLPNFFAVVMPYILFGQLFGTLPAVLLGLVSGMISGLCFRTLQRRDRLRSGKVEGFWLALGLAVIFLGGWAWVSKDSSDSFLDQLQYRYFQLSLGAIVPLYLAAGAWGGGRLVRQWQREASYG